MAGGPGRSDPQDQRVLIAIDQDFLDLERVARSLPLLPQALPRTRPEVRKSGLAREAQRFVIHEGEHQHLLIRGIDHDCSDQSLRSEEHTSELQSLMRISYAVFCLKK